MERSDCSLLEPQGLDALLKSLHGVSEASLSLHNWQSTSFILHSLSKALHFVNRTLAVINLLLATQMDDFLLRGVLCFRACSSLHDDELVAFAETEDELAESLDNLVADILGLDTIRFGADRVLVLRSHQLHQRVDGCLLDPWPLKDVAADIQERVKVQVRQVFQVDVIARLADHVQEEYLQQFEVSIFFDLMNDVAAKANLSSLRGNLLRFWRFSLSGMPYFGGEVLVKLLVVLLRIVLFLRLLECDPAFHPREKVARIFQVLYAIVECQEQIDDNRVAFFDDQQVLIPLLIKSRLTLIQVHVVLRRHAMHRDIEPVARR